MGSKFALDLLERSGWTGVEAALALLIADLSDLSAWWVVPVGAALAAAKSWVGGRIGRKGTASTLPAAADPAGPPVTGVPGPGTM